jgi:uncharacterized RDD family membrane protein YckC
METVGVGRRALAVIIDSILLCVVGYAIAAMTGGTTSAGFHIEGAPFFLWLAISLGYYIVMEATSGATLGKRVMGIKVVKQDGTAIDWQAAIVRNLLRLVDGLFLYLVGAIVVWISKSRQRLGDMAAHTLVVSARAIAVLALACAFGGVATEARAGAPRYTDMVISEAKDGAAKSTFKPATAKIYVRAQLADVPRGSKLRSDWIAVKAKGAPENYKIDSAELTMGPLMNRVDFNFSKPTNGWPEGDYRVDLFIDGKPAAKIPFKVAP